MADLKRDKKQTWSEKSTIVFKLFANDDAVDRALKIIQQLYYTDVPKCPTRVPSEAKDLKHLLGLHRLTAEYVGEFLSVKNAKSNASERVLANHGSVGFRYLLGNDFTVQFLIDTCLRLKRSVEEAYILQKATASEVLVFLMSDMDRQWNGEIGHGLPISYLFKGYSFPINTTRRIVEKVLQECHERGAHVPCVTFDGQFARLKGVDAHDSPQTLFAAQRTLWSKAREMKKTTLLQTLISMYGECEYTMQMNASTDVGGFLYLDSKLFCCFKQGQEPTCNPYTTLASKSKIK